MVSTPELRAFCERVHEVPGAGHNAHVEKPAAIVELFEKLI